MFCQTFALPVGYPSQASGVFHCNFCPWCLMLLIQKMLFCCAGRILSHPDHHKMIFCPEGISGEHTNLQCREGRMHGCLVCNQTSGTDKRGVLFLYFFLYSMVAELDQKTTFVAVQVLPLSKISVDLQRKSKLCCDKVQFILSWTSAFFLGVNSIQLANWFGCQCLVSFAIW